jgi:hypothetical protein
MIRDMGMHQKLIGLIGGLDTIIEKSQRLRLREGVSPELLKQIQTKVRDRLIKRLKELFGSLESALDRVAPNQKRLIKIIMDDAARGRVTPLMT